MNISGKIFELIREKGMTQKEFGRRTGIPQSTISDWKSKKLNPSSDKILIICDVLDVSPYELLGGAEQYLLMLNGSSDEDLDAYLAETRKMKDSVTEAAIQSWQSSKKDLGEFKEIISREIERSGEDGYKAVLTAEYEKRNLTFSLTAEEVYENGGSRLTPTEINISPAYTTGEKLAKAGLNTLMGMGTVFLVLIFISLLIAQFKKINALEKKMKADKAAKEAAARAAAAPARQGR